MSRAATAIHPELPPPHPPEPNKFVSSCGQLALDATALCFLLHQLRHLAELVQDFRLSTSLSTLRSPTLTHRWSRTRSTRSTRCSTRTSTERLSRPSVPSPRKENQIESFCFRASCFWFSSPRNSDHPQSNHEVLDWSPIVREPLQVPNPTQRFTQPEDHQQRR